MAFTFYKFLRGGEDQLFVEKRLPAQTSSYFYNGMALKVSAGKLVYASAGGQVYAISNVSTVSGDVSSDYKPEVVPVNPNQVWKGTLSSAASAEFLMGRMTNLDGAEAGTGIDGGVHSGATMWIYDFTSANSGVAFVVFRDPTTTAF